ncbi:unnamed protein product [Arabis nemorensis]|uniref:Reverse transcriptase domain-containing protein n=1 Tax=Arabis nemorensis TaxID=586526 RepID=A0A565CLR3_9BRAS|nr:unnamed protein product [Arabis nemorensis]
MSGLALSVQKTTFFSSGLSDAEAMSISKSRGIARGLLPVRYLGVSLCTKKLDIIQCEPLLQRIKTRMTTWASKTLSYAGRLQILTSVIAGISGFWCSTFLLPKECIDKINSLCGDRLSDLGLLELLGPL